MGQTGPLAMLAGFGTMAAAISGFFYPVGWVDRAPCGPFGAYTDYTSPRWLVAGADEPRSSTAGPRARASTSTCPRPRRPCTCWRRPCSTSGSTAGWRSGPATAT